MKATRKSADLVDGFITFTEPQIQVVQLLLFLEIGLFDALFRDHRQVTEAQADDVLPAFPPLGA